MVTGYRKVMVTVKWLLVIGPYFLLRSYRMKALWNQMP